MLYHLFTYLESTYDLSGAGLFEFITFRAAMSLITSLTIGIALGKRIIEWLQLKQVGEVIRDLGLQGQIEKKGTPTMGGVIILSAILIPTLLFADLTSVYTHMMLLVTVWLGTIGFIDDYIKTYKKNKEGLAGRFKIIGQVGVGVILGSIMMWHPDIVIKEMGEDGVWTALRSTETTIPFIKGNTFDYAWMISWLFEDVSSWVWIVFIPMVILIVTAVSNGANLTDGLDGLATGTSAIIGITLAILAYVSSNTQIAEYLGIMYIPGSEELVVFIAAFVGACIAFLWYNAFPAQVFMGDTGSLALGGIIAAFAIAIRKELMIPIFCGIFFIETLSVVLQVSYYKYTKKRFGVGKRIFLMSPIHHHFQKKGLHESKITTRFWIVCVFLIIIAFVTLKIR